MSEPTIPLIRRPTIHDFLLILDSQARCACTDEQRETKGKPEGRPEGIKQVVCEGCGAREVLNGVATLADTLRAKPNPLDGVKLSEELT